MNSPRRPVGVCATLALSLPLSLAAASGNARAHGQPEAAREEQPTAPVVVPADADPRIDSATGRPKLHWPRPRHFDHLHMRLSLYFPDMGQAELNGVAELTVRAIGMPRSVLELDCVGPTVSEVKIGDASIPFGHDGRVLTIPLLAPAAPDQDLTVTITYTAEFSKNRGEGLTWVKPKDEDDSPTQTSPQIYSQGEAQSNSTWFPCHDFPNERLTTELIVTVEDGYEVLSNGVLVSREAASEGRTRFHWKQDKDHVNYLVSLYIGKCSIVEIGGPDSARPGLPMPVYCPIGTEDQAKESMANVPAMVAFFEKYFDEPFPWDKYAQACIRGFNGGMENTSSTFLGTRAGTRKRGEMDDLLSHELAHQWTGDLITCNSWEHIWLNEGWASFAEALWDEELALQENAGKPNAKELAREAYEKSIIGQVRSQRRGNRSAAPTSPAMVSNRYSNPDAVFTRADNAYAKGAVILHMLRERLGHEVFDRGVRLYFDRFKFKTAETADFRRIMEEVSGESLEKFFHQWCYRPGIPRLSIDQTYDAAARTLTVKVSQIQKIDGHNPAYDLVVPIRVIFDGGEAWTTVHCDRSEQSVTIPLASAPTDVQVDPNLTVLASVTVHKPTAMWMRQLLGPSTAFARVQAMEHAQEVAMSNLAAAAVGVLGTDAEMNTANGGNP